MVINLFYILYEEIQSEFGFSKKFTQDMHEQYQELYDKYLSDIYYTVRKLRNGTKKKVPFEPFPAQPLIGLWKGYAQYHQVRNTRLLDELIDSMIRKVILIRIGTEVGGHTPHDPLEIIQSSVDENVTEDVVSRMSDYLVDKHGTWLISDYGLDKMEAIALQLLQRNIAPEQKLLLADQMLNVVHQRSDLAGWFVEGGRVTLDRLSE